MSLVLNCETEGTGATAWIDVVRVVDGVCGMYFVYRAATSANFMFCSSIIDTSGKCNGWFIQRTITGFLFVFVCAKAVNGFVNNSGAFYTSHANN